MNVPSISSPPNAPQKPKLSRRPRDKLHGVRRNLFPPSPPPAPKKEKKKLSVNITHTIFDYGCDFQASATEAAWLAGTEMVRERFLTNRPTDISQEEDIDLLKTLFNFYFSDSQPQNHYEHAYCEIMRDCIDARLSQLIQSPL